MSGLEGRGLGEHVLEHKKKKNLISRLSRLGVCTGLAQPAAWAAANPSPTLLCPLLPGPQSPLQRGREPGGSSPGPEAQPHLPRVLGPILCSAPRPHAHRHTQTHTPTHTAPRLPRDLPGSPDFLVGGGAGYKQTRSGMRVKVTSPMWPPSTCNVAGLN